MNPLAAALQFDRSLRLRAATRIVTLDEGVVILHDGLPDVYHLNSLVLDAPLAAGLDAEAVMALAEGPLGHLRHRQVIFDDGDAGVAIAPGFIRAGWSMQRTLFMGLGADAPGDQPGVAREVDADTLRELEVRLGREDPAPMAAGPGFAERLVQAMDALRDVTPCRRLAAGENGDLASFCTLFLEPGGRAALIDNVATLRASRRRGLARAVVSAAIGLARGEDRDPIVIPADADDWPKDLYARLGFEPLGVQVAFTLARTGGPTAV